MMKTHWNIFEVPSKIHQNKACVIFYEKLLIKTLSEGKTRPGVSSCPPGYKISSQNYRVSIEQNFASSNNVAVVETIKP